MNLSIPLKENCVLACVCWEEVAEDNSPGILSVGENQTEGRKREREGGREGEGDRKGRKQALMKISRAMCQ